MRAYACVVVVAALAVVATALPLSSPSSNLQLHLKFDEKVGASTFTDASSHSRHGRCAMSGASCPTAGATGKYSNAAYFAKHCRRTAYAVDSNGNPSSRGNTILDGANCGSRLDFNPVHFTDGTVMLWYQEDGDESVTPENMPVLESASPAPSEPKSKDHLKWRRAVGNGWDLSLVGGNGLSLGRISAQFWGGHWCGKWHTMRANPNARGGQSPQTRSADAMVGWDHLEWHHLAYVFSGSTVMLYVDGVRVAVFRNAATCQKAASFLGVRTVRYNAQNGVRETEMTGGSSARPRDDASGALNHQLKHMDWSRNYFKGKMDDVRIYNKVLTEAQIVKAMNNQAF